MPKTILVVDDDASRRETLAEAMVLEGHRAVIASTDEQALALFREAHPDLVLLDLAPPRMSGVEACRLMRAESSVPILALVPGGPGVDGVLAELDPIDAMARPFRLRELTVRVRALLRRADDAAARAAPDGLVDLGRVQVDLGARRLLRAGGMLALKPRAFDLLAFFIRNPGQVFTRDQLIERVWGPDSPGGMRTVDVHVHWLRQRIEADPAHPALLQTVRGIGYVFRRPA